ncbi:MAG TPA: AAA family ATPase [Bacilli bacterium]|nr:AAA family ATPase [Bacilli bacterium]
MFNKKWDLDLVGALASAEYVEEKMGREAVFINNQNSLQFNIKLISQTPENFPNILLFSAFASDIEQYGFEEDYTAPREVRIEQLRDFFRDKLVVFNPVRRMTPRGEEVFKVANVRVVPKPAGFLENTTFTPVPVFSEKTQGDTYEQFWEKLWSNRFVGRIENLSTEAEDTPPHALWRHEDDTFDVIGEFDRHRYAYGGFALQFDQLKVAPFQDEWFEDAFLGPNREEIMFIGTEAYNRLLTMMDEAEPIDSPEAMLEESAGEAGAAATTAKTVKENATPTAGAGTSKATEATSATGVSTESEVSIADAVTATLTRGAEDGEQTSATSTAVGKDDAVRSTDERSEDGFLQHFIQMTRDRSLLYAESDLINFHTAMKSSTMVILSGMSGTGKSRLVEVYARALGIKTEDPQLRIIPVRPSWTDDADLVGYVDSIHNVYRPGDSGLIDTLIQADREDTNSKKVYIVCFDEMNLARVEHYFSQFLSVLEMPSSQRKLRLYNDELEHRLYNSARYPATVSIGDNVIFVGTVNLDESTYHFSDKVLDRANVITLDVLPFRKLKDLKEKKLPAIEPWTFNEFSTFKSAADTLQLKDREIEFLEQVHAAFQTMHKGQGIGHRIVRQIDSYLKNLPQGHALSRSAAFDLQIVQRILTKLRGPEELLKPLLGSYNLDTGEVNGSRLLDLLAAFADISAFDKTRAKIEQKAKELRLNGYTV